MARKTTRSTAQKKRTARKTQEAASFKQIKPVFRTGTWATLLLLAVLIGVTYYMNREEDGEDIDALPTSEIAFVFDQDRTVAGIEITPADGETVKVVRNAENTWVLMLPDDVEADQGLVEAAASQLTALRIISEVDADLKILGLDKPAYIIIIVFTDGEKHTLEIGENTPSNSGYYVRLDRKKTLIVALGGIESLINLVIFPPRLYTPTPTSLPATPTPDSPPDEAPAPEITVTPSP